jgi:hypothetical protein
MTYAVTSGFVRRNLRRLGTPRVSIVAEELCNVRPSVRQNAKGYFLALPESICVQTVAFGSRVSETDAIEMVERQAQNFGSGVCHGSLPHQASAEWNLTDHLFR